MKISGKAGPRSRQNKEPRNHEKTERVCGKARMQQWHKGAMPKTAATQRNGIKNPDTRRQKFLMSERRTSECNRKSFGLEFVKQANRMSSVFRGTRKWTMWRGRSPPKRRKD
jgi:hypothetical protein